MPVETRKEKFVKEKCIEKYSERKGRGMWGEGEGGGENHVRARLLCPMVFLSFVSSRVRFSD